MLQVNDRVVKLGFGGSDWKFKGIVVGVLDSGKYLVEYSENGKVYRNEFDRYELCSFEGYLAEFGSF